MTQVAPSQSAAKLREALSALKRAADKRRRLDEGTTEYARALDLENGWIHEVYELASAIDEPPD